MAPLCGLVETSFQSFGVVGWGRIFAVDSRGVEIITERYLLIRSVIWVRP